MAETPRPDRDSAEESFMDYVGRKTVVLPRNDVLRAVDELLREPERPPTCKRTRAAASLCADRSHVRLARGRPAGARDDVCLWPVMREMRHCVLTGDWDGHKELLCTLLRSPNVGERYVAFVVRSCFALLFNHPCRTPDTVDDFLASCLRIKEPARRLKYLQDCFSMSGRTAANRDRADVRAERQQQPGEEGEEEEEEMFFYSDCSSSD